LADSDSDGIPDVWESAYFGGDTAAARDADADSDGMSNWQEYVAGTDPTNTLSYLKFDNLTIQSGATLTFGAVSNKTYTIQYTDAPGSGQWSKLADVYARATNHAEVVIDPSSNTSRVYRIATPQQP
jgi:hypothetical protein